jgi:hypothetical protein
MWLRILVLIFIFCSWSVYSYTLDRLLFDWIEWTTLEIRNEYTEYTLGYPFYLKIFTLNSSLNNLVSRYEYVKVKHRNDCGYIKMKTYLRIRLLAETVFLRISYITDHKLFFVYFDLIARIANFFSLSRDSLYWTINYCLMRNGRWNEY